MSRSRTRRRIPVRLVAAAVGALLVVANGALVLGPVLGLVGAAASVGPLLEVPVGGIAVAVVLGYLLAVGCVLLAAISRPTWLTWTFALAAFVASSIASVLPILATANAAVDRVGEVIPWIVDLVGRVL